MNINETIVFVTGGASGLGEATIQNIVAHGGQAVIADIDEDKGRKLAAELNRKSFRKTIFVKTDITDEVSVSEALNLAVKEFGTVNAIVNCAGIAPPGKVLGKSGPLSLSTFEKVIQINLTGTFNVLRLASEIMVNNSPNDLGERGVIINTASIAAYDGQIGQAAYGASKSGVVGLTLPVAREMASHGIRVMTIAPGLFNTPMFDSLPEKAKETLGSIVPFPPRLGQPIEYAQLVQQIIENPMLNGTTIRLDGAIRMQPK
ncbi:MAG: 3-hydroxyacyl-CoA dehydrogenase [Desulfitobacteriaceae bacterium]|nr:3-hydroxyacyl-CoA dehydrogenase [Desulfitobacteriaceae bacterium]MDD4346371.1 3-hydroxyacyl-CoA dehydrogenase [Desulfitobacteriaceae bacterium]MDD4401515.1 3-hydroxyacyl-CoA dehydrogenase [Desulfitobacteriaceae bacterium]